MSQLVKIKDIEFQPIEYSLQEKANDIFTLKFKKKGDHQALHETVQQVTENHFSKLYEYIYLGSKELTTEISKVTRKHFLDSTKKSKTSKQTLSPLPILKSRILSRVLVPLKGQSRANLSFIQNTIEDEESFVKNNTSLMNINDRSYNTLDQPRLSNNQRVYSRNSIKRKEIPSSQIANAGKYLTEGSVKKIKLPRTYSFNESLEDPTQRSQQKQKTEIDLYPSIAQESQGTSKQETPRAKSKGGFSIINNVLSNHLFNEKHSIIVYF